MPDLFSNISHNHLTKGWHHARVVDISLGKDYEYAELVYEPLDGSGNEG